MTELLVDTFCLTLCMLNHVKSTSGKWWFDMWSQRFGPCNQFANQTNDFRKLLMYDFCRNSDDDDDDDDGGDGDGDGDGAGDDDDGDDVHDDRDNETKVSFLALFNSPLYNFWKMTTVASLSDARHHVFAYDVWAQSIFWLSFMATACIQWIELGEVRTFLPHFEASTAIFCSRIYGPMGMAMAQNRHPFWDHDIPSGKLTVCYWKWPSRNSGFSH